MTAPDHTSAASHAVANADPRFSVALVPLRTGQQRLKVMAEREPTRQGRPSTWRLPTTPGPDLTANGEFGRPIGRRSLTRVRSTLVNAIRNDLRRGLVTRNVAELSLLPAETTQPIGKRALSFGELERLLRAIEGPAQVLVDLSGRNGLRPAEARALRWSRVDLEASTLTVDAQLNRRSELTPPKTKNAQRTIPFDELTARLLRERRSEQAEQRAYAGVVWRELDLVVTTRSGLALSHRNFHRSLRAACLRAQVDPPISAYELRHTAITLQAEAGHPAWRIADWAGTSERMITDVYRHKLAAISPLGPVRG